MQMYRYFGRKREMEHWLSTTSARDDDAYDAPVDKMIACDKTIYRVYGELMIVIIFGF